MSPMMIDRVMIPGCHLHTTKHAKKLGKARSSQTVLVTWANRKHRGFTYGVDVMNSWHFSGEELKHLIRPWAPGLCLMFRMAALVLLGAILLRALELLLSDTSLQ